MWSQVDVFDMCIGDGGHYDAFGSKHDVNYHLRTIAHNTILVHDPAETGPGIRAGSVTGIDGGQSHDWPHHNGAVADPQQWHEQKHLYDIADILAFEDRGFCLYVAGDCTKAYSPKKLEYFTRQILFLRPGTFVIFDRVRSKNPLFKKTWLLQAMKPPTRSPDHLVITNGKGRVFVQTLLPTNPEIRLASGADLYTYDGKSYPPSRDTGPAPQCRIEISPCEQSPTDHFLHVLTATNAETDHIEKCSAQIQDRQITVTLGQTKIVFNTSQVAGRIDTPDHQMEFTDKIDTGSGASPEN